MLAYSATQTPAGQATNVSVNSPFPTIRPPAATKPFGFKKPATFGKFKPVTRQNGETLEGATSGTTTPTKEIKPEISAAQQVARAVAPMKKTPVIFPNKFEKAFGKKA
jgi:hypothetical protein